MTLDAANVMRWEGVGTISEETEQVERYDGFNFIWRRPFTRDWLYLSLGHSITWPRYHLDEKRELSLGFGVWIEMEFGDWVWRGARRIRFSVSPSGR